MNITVKRETFTHNSTIGEMYINDVFECYTLEDTDRHMEAGGIKIQNETAIPRGKYKVIIDFSDRFKKDMPHILNVPNFTGIRIHNGNTATDTDGCILVGQTRGLDFIGYSVKAFDSFFPKLKKAFDIREEISIEIQ